MKKERKGRRSTIKIMAQLIGLVYPLLHIMLAAVIFGVAGYLCAIFLTIFAGQVLVDGFGTESVIRLFGIMVLAAVFRGMLHYIEQYCNHFIAFKLLAIIRHKSNIRRLLSGTENKIGVKKYTAVQQRLSRQ